MRSSIPRSRLFGLYVPAALLLGLLVVDPLGWRRPDVSAVVEAFMRATAVPGGVVAVGRIGEEPRLLAFGTTADGQAPMTPDMILPLASLSKPLTAAAILDLSERGLLSLDQRLDTIVPAVADAPDRRHGAITIRDLLQHSAGWAPRAFEPVTDPETARARLGHATENCGEIALAMLRLPLDFAPGTAQHYANLGYCWLGVVITAVTGLSPETYVAQHILEPAGIHDLRPGTGMIGGLSARRLGPVGGWVGSARAYYRFMNRDWAAMEAPAPAIGLADGSRYVLGWRRWPDGTLTHFGFLPGVFTLAMMRPNGAILVALFDERPAGAETLAVRLVDALSKTKEMHEAIRTDRRRR